MRLDTYYRNAKFFDKGKEVPIERNCFLTFIEAVGATIVVCAFAFLYLNLIQ